MSSFIFPALPGIDGLEVTRNYVWKTAVQEAISGKMTAVSLRVYPLVHYELIVNLMRNNQTPSELLQLQGLYNAMRGRLDTFLYTDPEFHSVTGQQFGTGDAATTDFQLTANFQNVGGPGAPELIQNLNGAPQIFVNGALLTPGTNYTIGATGIVSFVTHPAAAAVLTWTGSFFYRCRFDEDEVVWSKFMSVGLWTVKKLMFTSVKLVLPLLAVIPILHSIFAAGPVTA
jgi:uncharacterized protein (TIGR02217 family)